MESIPMIRVVLDFAIEGIRGREVYWPKAPDPKLAEVEAVQAWEEQLIRAGLATLECGCCVDAEASYLELHCPTLYKGRELLMQYPIDTKGA
jgi:hypothetical protein